MIWVMAYLWLWLATFVASLFFIPLDNLRTYQRCEKGRDYYLGLVLVVAIAVTGMLEAVFLPKDGFIPWRIYGAVVYVLGQALITWASRVNPFFLPAIRRPAFLVTVGPYKFCRHPGYAGMAFSAAGTVILFRSTFALIPMVLYLALLLQRVRRENRLLYAD